MSNSPFVGGRRSAGPCGVLTVTKLGEQRHIPVKDSCVEVAIEGKINGKRQPKQGGNGTRDIDGRMAPFVGGFGGCRLGAMDDGFCFLDALPETAVGCWIIPPRGRCGPHSRYNNHRICDGLHPGPFVELDPPIGNDVLESLNESRNDRLPRFRRN